MSKFSTLLLKHFDIHARKLPWRENISPYRVWLSEIMLQQTTVATVIPYYLRFLEAFPTVEDLANADLDDILHLWQGLGYYSRARNLHKCASVIVSEHNGNFPETREKLLTLPGVGPYTASAVASIAFNQIETVVDGNVERVISRLYKVETPLPKAKKEITEIAEKLNDTKRPADYSGAIMDLGATICTPKKPKCMLCPAVDMCKAHKDGTQEEFPKKEPKKKRPEKQGSAYIFMNSKNEIYLERRADTGLLAKLWQVPNNGWEQQSPSGKNLPFPVQKEEKLGKIRHVFTHFALELEVFLVFSENMGENWFSKDQLPPTPTLMKKVIKLLEK